jgi:hypothetical protein
MSYEKEVEHARASLRKRSWKVILVNNWLTKSAVQPAAKFTLASTGMNEGFYVAAEVRADFKEDNKHRIDVVWFDTENWEPAIAFEIDGSVSKHSVDKIERMAEQSDIEMAKVIVSKSPNKTYIKQKAEENLPDDFYHIDVGFHEHT